ARRSGGALGGAPDSGPEPAAQRALGFTFPYRLLEAAPELGPVGDGSEILCRSDLRAAGEEPPADSVRRHGRPERSGCARRDLELFGAPGPADDRSCLGYSRRDPRLLPRIACGAGARIE